MFNNPIKVLKSYLTKLFKRKPVYGLMVNKRPYKCTECGAEKEISTNHTARVFDKCTCRGGVDYRTFSYCGDGSDIVKNPYLKTKEYRDSLKRN